MTAAVAKYNTTSVATDEDIKSIELCDRTTRVDLMQIKTKAGVIFGKKIALAWSMKFALRGMKLKEGDYVVVSGVKMTASEYKLLIADKEKNPGYSSKAEGGISRDSDKSVVSNKRMVRAFAPDITFAIKKGIKVADDVLEIGEGTGLPTEYMFIDSWYGCDDKSLEKLAPAMASFCKRFDAKIDEAYRSGYVEGAKKYSHYTAFVNYCKWRGFALE